MKKVAVISGSRADYGIYFPLLKTIQNDTELELNVVVKAMHLLKEHGDTVQEIKRDGFPIREWGAPDAMIVLGDRDEMLFAAIAAAHCNIPICHIHGGDRSGSIDESNRHAITRFAHLHFPSSKEDAKRLVKMGEERWRINVVGPLGIYAMPDAEFIPRVNLLRGLGLSDKPIILVIQHPVTTQVHDSENQIRITLTAVSSFLPDCEPVVIYPNSDAGSEAMIETIESWNLPKFKSLSYLTFLSLLKESAVIVGNSSCAIREAPLFGIPAVNIGTRQLARHSNGVVANVPHDREAISKAIVASLARGRDKSVNPYKHLDGVRVILDTLKKIEPTEKLLQKRLTY